MSNTAVLQLHQREAFERNVTRALVAGAGAGVIAFLFGRGADGNTCACDAAHDGVTNPAPINGNRVHSYSADDDGGFFRKQAKSYYKHKALSLPD